MNDQIRNLVTRHSSLVTAPKGFTLIELAIVLVIVGMLVGMGAGLMGPLTKRAKVHETKEIVSAAAESLISYGATNNELPDTSTFPSEVGRSNDVWGQSLNYIVDNDLNDSSLGGICERKSTNLTVNICSDTGCSSPDARTDIAFIIFSSGENMNNQTAETDEVTSATIINTYDYGLNIDNYPTDMSRTEPYDDIVKWISLKELRTKAGCVGPQIKILNNEVPVGKNGSPYNADVYADGGVPFTDLGDSGSEPDYQWCWQPDPTKGDPPGVDFLCNGALGSSPTCTLTSGTWNQCTSLSLGNTPTAANTYKLTFVARDNNGNIIQKSMVLTVNN